MAFVLRICVDLAVSVEFGCVLESFNYSRRLKIAYTYSLGHYSLHSDYKPSAGTTVHCCEDIMKCDTMESRVGHGSLLSLNPTWHEARGAACLAIPYHQ